MSINNVVLMGFGNGTVDANIAYICELGFTPNEVPYNLNDIVNLDNSLIPPSMTQQKIDGIYIMSGEGQSQVLVDQQKVSNPSGPYSDFDPNNITDKYAGRWAYRKYYRRNRSP